MRKMNWDDGLVGKVLSCDHKDLRLEPRLLWWHSRVCVRVYAYMHGCVI